MTGRRSRLLLGVTGGIAAYKAAELVRRFRGLDWEIQVVMTAAACRLVGTETLAVLSGRPVARELFPRHRPAGTMSASGSVEHIDLARWADVVLVAPATANCLGKLSAGIADDLFSTLMLAVPAETLESGRVLLAPAMNSRMWEHPSVRRNVAQLEQQGYRFIPPESGELACGWSGTGRLAGLEEIAGAVLAAARPGDPLPDLRRARVIVTAGRTEEPLDPVRVLTNRSSGRLGIALARAFRLAGAETRLVCGAVSVPLPSAIPVETATTAAEMLAALERAAPDCDILVMCAAVGDYRPARPARAKTRDAQLTLRLEKTPDILKALSAKQRPRVVIGFSHDPAVKVARAKLRAKGLNLIVANPYATAGAETIRPTLIPARGGAVRLPDQSKESFSRRLVVEAGKLLAGSRS